MEITGVKQNIELGSVVLWEVPEFYSEMILDKTHPTLYFSQIPYKGIGMFF